MLIKFFHHSASKQATITYQYCWPIFFFFGSAPFFHYCVRSLSYCRSSIMCAIFLCPACTRHYCLPLTWLQLKLFLLFIRTLIQPIYKTQKWDVIVFSDNDIAISLLHCEMRQQKNWHSSILTKINNLIMIFALCSNDWSTAEMRLHPMQYGIIDLIRLHASILPFRFEAQAHMLLLFLEILAPVVRDYINAWGCYRHRWVWN